MPIQDQEQDQDLRTTYSAAGAARFPQGCGKVLTRRRPSLYRALAYRVIDTYGAHTDQGDLEELVKTACARCGAAYDSETVRKAVDAALHVRRHGRAMTRRTV